MAEAEETTGAIRVAFHTFGCKANQYDSEWIRRELEARGATRAQVPGQADVLVVNTCTVTSQAEADARRFLRRSRRDHPGVRLLVVGCSAALDPERYREMGEVDGVVAGHDPVAVTEAIGLPAPGLVQIGVGRTAMGARGAPVPSPAADRPLLAMPPGTLRRPDRSRAWLKIQDGCDRHCSFCATRLARGPSRSRLPADVVSEARKLAELVPEIVLTGIHIGHYGVDLDPPSSLSGLVALLLETVPAVRFRLGSIEATEVDDLLVELLATSAGRLAPHLHMPLQSGADPVLRRMRRWHTREMYRVRALEIAERVGVGSGGSLGLGADLITGFPGETDEDHAQTVALVDELPYTYLHVFPFSPREGTVAAELQREIPVPQRVAGERSRELRDLVQAKGEAYRHSRCGAEVRVAVEGVGGHGERMGLTGDYLHLPVIGSAPVQGSELLPGRIEGTGGEVQVRLL